MQGLRPSSSTRHANQSALLAFAVLAAGGTVGGFFAARSATAAVGLFAVLLALGWMTTATILTRFCDGRRLVLQPPQIPAAVRALVPFELHIVLGNGSLRSPVLFPTIELACSIAGYPLPSPPQFLGQLGPGVRAQFRWRLTVRRRGLHSIDGIRVSTTFPGSLLTSETRFAFSGELVALPAIYELHSQARDLFVGRRHASGRTYATPTASDEFVGARDYRPGDNPRGIDFKLSVRRADYPIGLIVREYEDSSEDDVCIVLDTLVEPDAEGSLRALYRHEKSICFTIAVCRLLLRQKKRVRVRIASDGSEPFDRLLEKPSDLPELEAWCASLTPCADPKAIWRLLMASQRSNATILYVSLRDELLERTHPKLTALTVPPDWQAGLVREVVAP
jgi:uncharacterized protein (DUF58 family)